jgi:hypothetical protein
MRVLAIVVIGGALLAYGLTRPSPAPPVKTAFAELPSAAAKPGEAPMASPARPGPQPARSNGPLSRSPPVQAQSTARTNPANKATTPAPSPSTAKRTAEVLTAAAIAALIVAESRRAYHATGRPCACPDDSMRNGRACGGRSAFSRPGGASPLCYPTDVTEAMIKSYRSRVAER